MATDSTLNTKLAEIEEKANIIYTNKQMQKVLNNLQSNPKMQDIVEELKKEKYEIEAILAGDSQITGIALDKQSIKMTFEQEKTIRVILQGSNELYRYYVSVNGKKYEMHFDNGMVKIDRTESENIENSMEKPTLTASGNDTDVVNVTTIDEVENIIKITANQKEGTTKIIVNYGSYEKECKILVRENLDEIPPQKAKIELCSNTTNPDEPVEATIIHEDNEGGSGIQIGSCKWLYSANDKELGVDNIDWNEANSFNENGETINLVAKEGTYYLHVLSVDADENKTETTTEAIIVEDLTKKWNLSKVRKVTSEDGIVVPVPNGFTPSTVDGEKSVNTGFVIKQGNNGEITEGINEFVWVPVHCDKKTFEVIDGNNVGILYRFGNATSPKNPPEKINYEADLQKEPVVLPSENFNIVKSYIPGIENEQQFKELLQNEFDTMKQSIETYKGFYIGRYETGNLNTDTVVVEKNNSNINHASCWHEIYQKSRNFASGMDITSTMIWGCQWDATLRWFLKSDDANVVKYVVNPEGQGVHNQYYGPEPTGQYKVNNIYDMAGNVSEWTMTKNGLDTRAARGGDYYNSAKYGTAYISGTTAAGSSGSQIGSRIALVI